MEGQTPKSVWSPLYSSCSRAPLSELSPFHDSFYSKQGVEMLAFSSWENDPGINSLGRGLKQSFKEFPLWGVAKASGISICLVFMAMRESENKWEVFFSCLPSIKQASWESQKLDSYWPQGEVTNSLFFENMDSLREWTVWKGGGILELKEMWFDLGGREVDFLTLIPR